MTYTPKEINGVSCLVYSDGECLLTENDVNDILSAGFSHDIPRILLYDKILSDDFFRLQTGLAGILLQKCANYQFKAAVVLTDAARAGIRFRELMGETNQGQIFAVFATQEKAEAWLTN